MTPSSIVLQIGAPMFHILSHCWVVRSKPDAATVVFDLILYLVHISFKNLFRNLLSQRRVLILYEGLLAGEKLIMRNRLPITETASIKNMLRSLVLSPWPSKASG